MSEQSKEYQRGYAAGRKKQLSDADRKLVIAETDRLWNETFIAALSVCIDVRGWTCGDKPINSIPERVKLARDFANEADRYMRKPK